MSLFSGMKITGAAADSKQNISAEKKPDKQRQECSSFSFLSQSPSGTQTNILKREGGVEETISDSQAGNPVKSVPSSNFEFINTPLKSKENRVNISDVTTPYVCSTDSDLDLDLELDPLKPTSRSTDLVAARGGTELEGIDFSQDLDLSDSHRHDQGLNLEDAISEERDANDAVRHKTSPREKDSEIESKADHETCDDSINQPVGSNKYSFILSKDERTNDRRNPTSDVNSDSTCEVDDAERDMLSEERSKDCTDPSPFSFISKSECTVSSSETDMTLRSNSGENVKDNLLRKMSTHEGTVLSQPLGSEPPALSGSIYHFEMDVGDLMELLHEAKAAADLQLRSEQDELTAQLESQGRDCLLSVINLITKQEKLNQLQTRQTEAVSEEDYEKAEMLMKECSSLAQDIRKIPNIMLHTTESVKDIIQCNQELLKQRSKQSAEWRSQYLEVKVNQESAIEKLKATQVENTDGQKHKLEMERTELDRAMGHLLLDKNHVSRRESQLEARIDEKTADIRATKDKLLQQKTEIQNEIALLEERLTALKSEEQNLNSAINEQNKAIDEVKSEFQEEISIIEEERNNVRDREERLNEEKSLLDDQEKTLDEKMQQFETKMASEEEWLSRINKCIDDIGESVSEEGESEDLLSDLVIQLAPSEEIDRLREKLEGTIGDIQTTSALILHNQTKAMTLKKKVTDTEDHIATLQGAKQLAVSSRNFGEAKRLADEIKSKMVEGQSLQAEVEGVTEQQKVKSKLLEEFQQLAEKLKIELADAENKWELDLRDQAVAVIADIEDRLDRAQTQGGGLMAKVLLTEQQACALLVSWLSDRHQLPRPPDVDKLCKRVEELEAGELSRVPKVEDGDADHNDDRGVEAELNQLEERLQQAVEEEDYESAECIQKQIDDLQTLVKSKTSR